eukprot:13940698-Alexandrium_andersonii.AAC.1
MRKPVGRGCLRARACASATCDLCVASVSTRAARSGGAPWIDAARWPYHTTHMSDHSADSA